MNIITNIPPSGTAVRDALIREIKTGFQLQRERERKDELEATAQAKVLKEQKSVKNLGKCVAVIPADTYYLLNNQYGRDEVHSTEFLRYYNKKYPHLSPNKA